MKKRRKGVKITKLTDHQTSLGERIIERRLASISLEGVPPRPMGEEAEREGRREEE